MTDSGKSHQPAADDSSESGDPLTNLTRVRTRMDSLQRFLSDSVNRKTILPKQQMEMVSSELISAIHQVIINGAALIASSNSQTLPTRPDLLEPDPVELDADDAAAVHVEVVELDAVELMAEHIHFCDICGKGFKRDANLRMHMRAHGDRFKSPGALSNPDKLAGAGKKTRFSCPYLGCNRNKNHENFRPLKSVICVKNHFKRSHCPKMYSCNRCLKKNFSVVADLRSHLKHCGGGAEKTKWICSCGARFSRKDKLFGHMALFEGHMPAVSTAAAAAAEEEVVVADVGSSVVAFGSGGDRDSEDGLLEGLMEGFGSIDNQCLQQLMMGSSSTSSPTLDVNMIEELFNF